MRRAAFCLLVATTLGGCNQIFGLEATTGIPDAPDAPPPDSAWASIRLGFLQLTFDPSGTVPQPIETPFPDLTMVKVGPSEGPTVERPLENGIITIPPDISAGKFRLVYQRPNDTTREYQGLVPDAHVIEALFGSVTRVPPPAGAGFAITPTGYPVAGNHNPNRVFTVGSMWTEGAIVAAPAGALFNYGYEASTAESMSGAFGATAATDRGVLVDYVLDPSCRRAVGSTDFPGGPLTTAHQPVSGPWVTDGATPLAKSETDDASVDFNIEIAQLGEDLNMKRTTENYGFTPSALMPAFTRPPDGLRQVVLPNPVMMVLRSCTTLDTDDDVHEPTLFKDKLTRALYTEVSVPRSAGGVGVNNGVAVLTLPIMVMGMPKFDVRTLVAFPVDVKLKTAAAMVSLMGSDDAPIPATTGTVTLAWSKYKTTELVDFWEVTLSVITAGTATKRRIYTTTTPEVKIEGSELHLGEHYLLQITGYLGRPNAATGDFRTVQGAQSMSVFYPRTFLVVP